MQNRNHYIVIAGAIAAFTGVALGAFGAHALKADLEARATVATWKTAVDYQMWHALALVILGAWGHRPLRRAAAIALAIGILFFSGSLYWLALGGPRWLGPITPLGGFAFILGWVFVLIDALRTPLAEAAPKSD